MDAWESLRRDSSEREADLSLTCVTLQCRPAGPRTVGRIAFTSFNAHTARSLRASVLLNDGGVKAGQRTCGIASAMPHLHSPVSVSGYNLCMVVITVIQTSGQQQ